MKVLSVFSSVFKRYILPRHARSPFCGQVQDLRRGESPGPGTYDNKRGAMSPRSARIGDAVAWFPSTVSEVLECYDSGM